MIEKELKDKAIKKGNCRDNVRYIYINIYTYIYKRKCFNALRKLVIKNKTKIS